MIRHLARILAVAMLGGVALVACSDQQQACAASLSEPMKPAAQQTSKPNPPKVNPPKTGRTTSKVQDKPKTGSGTNSGGTKKTTTINPNWKSTSKPTTWGGYKQSRNWSQPYHSGYPAPQQPVIVHVHNYDYRTYPGYVGYYPVGVWPVGYGERYGCVADNESTPQPTENPSPAPATVTVTVPPPVTVTVPPSATPSETPR